MPYLCYIYIFQTNFLETVCYEVWANWFRTKKVENFPGLAHLFNMNATRQIAKNNSISIIDQSCKPKLHLIETVKIIRKCETTASKFFYSFAFFFFFFGKCRDVTNTNWAVGPLFRANSSQLITQSRFKNSSDIKLTNWVSLNELDQIWSGPSGLYLTQWFTELGQLTLTRASHN